MLVIGWYEVDTTDPRYQSLLRAARRAALFCLIAFVIFLTALGFLFEA
jgi:hypothetical protein